MNDTLANALGVILAAFLAALTPTLILLAKRAGEYLASLASLKLSEQQKADIEWAVRTSVDAAQEAGNTALKGMVHKGAAKLELAKHTARSLAPKAIGTLDEEQLTEVIHAAVERKRSSTPSYSLMPMGLSYAPTNPPPAASSSSSGNWEPVSAIDLPDGVPKPRPSMPEPTTLRGDIALPAPSRVPSDVRAVPPRHEEPDVPTRPATPSAKRRSP